VGLILDSSIIIAGERRGESVRQVLERVQFDWGEAEIGLSALTIVELVHGVYRAKSEQSRSRRQSFVEELIRDVPVHPVTVETARLAGRIEGEQAEQGITIPMEDLLIGATALHLGFGVATLNVRHFRLVPNLIVVQPKE